VNAIRGIYKGGRLELQALPDWPDGTEVLVEPAETRSEKIGIDESEWLDDPASLADWEAWIKTFEPLEFTPEEARGIAEFDEKMRRFNIEAVRRQMQEGADG
jgi:hypothetical protein